MGEQAGEQPPGDRSESERDEAEREDRRHDRLADAGVAHIELASVAERLDRSGRRRHQGDDESGEHQAAGGGNPTLRAGAGDGEDQQHA